MAQLGDNERVIEPLLIAAPPAPEPNTNYFEVISIPLLVAVVTAVITSWLTGRRSATDRLANLRLEAYNDALLAATAWAHAAERMRWKVKYKDQEVPLHLFDDHGDMKLFVKYLEALPPEFEALHSSIQRLNLVASKRSMVRLRKIFEEMLNEERADDDTLTRPFDFRSETSRAKLSELIDVLIDAARRDIRRGRI